VAKQVLTGETNTNFEMDQLNECMKALVLETNKTNIASTSSATLKAMKIKSRKYNSTSSMHVGDTLSQPNNDLTILGVSEKLFSYITLKPVLKECKDTRVQRISIGSIENQPPTSHAVTIVSDTEIPSTDSISFYLRQIFQTAQCSVDCTIVCLIYIERLLERSGLKLTVKNWRSLIAIGMLLASKVNDDLSMVNADFAVFLPFKVDQINKWERQFLAGIKYDVRVAASQYTKYYFDLRENTLKDIGNSMPLKLDGNPLLTLDVEQAERLELLSSNVQRRMDEMRVLENGTPRIQGGKMYRRAVSDQYCPAPQNLTNGDDDLPEPPVPHHGTFTVE
jgi:ribosomal protein L18